MEELEEQLLREVLSFYRGKKNELIPILLEVQGNFSYLPEDAIQLIASFLNIAEGEIYSVASFYAQFRLLPLGDSASQFVAALPVISVAATRFFKK